MASSVVNSLRNILSDNFWLFKMILYVLPVFYLINSDELKKYTQTDVVIIVCILSVVYLGVIGFMMNANINNKNPFLPGIKNIIDVIRDAICMSIVTLPQAAILYYVVNVIREYCHYDFVVMVVIYLALSIIFSPFIFIPAVLYSVRRNLADAFNFKVIFSSSGNFCVSYLAYLFQYIFVIFLGAFLIYELLINMLNDDLFLNILYSIFLVISVLSIYSYCSDLYGDVIDELPEKKRKNIKN